MTTFSSHGPQLILTWDLTCCRLWCFHHAEECFILRNHLVSIPSWNPEKPGLESVHPDSRMGILCTQEHGRQAHLDCSVWRGTPNRRDSHAVLCGSQELACSHSVGAPGVWRRMQPFPRLTK